MSASEIVLRMLEEKVGFSFLKEKKYLLETKIKKRMRLTGISEEEKYLNIVLKDEKEFQALVDLLAINHTFFFREPAHFEHLKNFISSLKFVTVKGWCAACSSGQEAYSIAFVVEQYKHSSVEFRLLATDIDNQALAKAQNGQYPLEELNHIPDEFHRFLQKEGQNFSVSSEIKKKILFRKINLVEFPYPLKGDLDFIFCRNVFIYFSPDMKHRAILEMVKLLKKGGFLYVGMSEPIVEDIEGLKKLGNAIYQRV